jgi:hypothetical protein
MIIIICRHKSDTSNGRDSLNHFKIIHKIPEQHAGKHEINEIEKIAILGTAHILREVLM